jgi:hypothetical protein
VQLIADAQTFESRIGCRAMHGGQLGKGSAIEERIEEKIKPVDYESRTE